MIQHLNFLSFFPFPCHNIYFHYYFNKNLNYGNLLDIFATFQRLVNFPTTIQS